jgi:two-component system nitrogen regulation response regulator GlnG/two-component system response regulator HydG
MPYARRVRARDKGDTRLSSGLMIAWFYDDPSRVGEVALFSEEGPEAATIGGAESSHAHPAVFQRQRPGKSEPGSALATGGTLLLVRAIDGHLEVAPAAGKRLRVNGAYVERASVGAGVVVTVPGEIVLLGVQRTAVLPVLRSFRPEHAGAFGEPDAFGIVGESPEAWRSRELLAVAARAPAHVLVEGPSGTGKGNWARALHALSPRAAGPFVVCSDGALPPSEEILARASGGTLVLDPVEALAPEAQRRFLQFARTQRPESLAADGRPPMQVRLVVLARKLTGGFGDELLARFLPLATAGFEDRRQDIPLIARARARALAESTLELLRTARAGALHIDGELVEALLRRRWAAGGFEMDRVLFRAARVGAADGLTFDAASSEDETEGTVHRSDHPPSSLAERLGFLTARTWGDVRIRPVDGLTVLVTVRTRTVRCMHVELGLASAKSKGPTKAWQLLLATCEGRGSFDWRHFGATRDTVRKQVERLSAALIDAFGLEDPPFEPFEPTRGWLAKFLAVPER